MRLGRQGTERHAGRDEAAADIMDAFDLVHRDRSRLAEIQQVAERRRRQFTNPPAVGLEPPVVAARGGVLQPVDQFRVPAVGLLARPDAVRAADAQRRFPGVKAPRGLADHLGLDPDQSDPRDTRGHPGEELGNQRPRQPQSLELAGPAIGGDDRDPLLGEDLHQPRLDRRLVVQAGLAQRQARIAPALKPLQKRLLRQPAVDRRGTDTDQHGEGMGVDRLGRAHHQRAEGSQPLIHQPAVHRRCGQDHRDQRSIRAHPLVGQDDQPGPAARRGDRFSPDTIQRGFQPPFAGREGAVDHRGRARADDVQHPLVHAGRQDRTVEHEHLRLGLVLGEDVAEVLEPRPQAHGPGFAQRIDRRIGDLGEGLAEIVGEGPVLMRQHRRRRVVAHGGHGLLAVARHRIQQGVDVFLGPADRRLEPGQGLARNAPGLRARPDQRLQFDHVRQPLPIGQRRRQTIHGLGLVVENAGFQIDRDHPPAADVQPPLDPVIGDAGHPDLGAADQQAVDGLGHPQRTQPVAVLARDHPATIGGADGGRTVPGLHHGVAIGVEGTVVVRDHALDRRLGHQQGLDHGRGATGADQHLKDIVQRRRVRTAGLDHRLDDPVIGPECLRSHADLVAAHPAGVAAQGVDLAVVGQHPERLGQPPLREGVGRIALVEQRHIGLDPRVIQVRIEVRQRLGQHHPLVDDRPRRQGADVEMLQA